MLKALLITLAIAVALGFLVYQFMQAREDVRIDNRETQELLRKSNEVLERARKAQAACAEKPASC